jgi:DNA-binding response OmpR family regulator
MVLLVAISFLRFCLVWGRMEPNTLLVVARSQTLAKRLRGALNAEQYLLRWVPSTTQALQLDLAPSLIVLQTPPSGGVRSVARLKRQFNVALLALLRSGQPVPDLVDASLPRSSPIEDVVDLIAVLLIKHSPDRVKAPGMSLDMRTRRLQINGGIYQLRPLGCQIMATLMGRPGEAIPRDELFRRVWHTEHLDSTRALDVHIAHLRRQLESDPRRPRIILTERGVGYRLQPPR